MKQRGRKSGLSVVRGDGISAVDRPEPLAELTNKQRIEWILIVNSLPADFFPPHSHNVLAQYCRHVVACRHVSLLIGQMEVVLDDEETRLRGTTPNTTDIDDYNRLLKMQERESRVLMSLATKMRLTQQSTILPDKIRAPTISAPPWEM